MNLLNRNLTEIKGGLSKKKVFRKIENNSKKIIIHFSNEEYEFFNFMYVYNILKKINISIPKIYEINLNKKIIIMEDFGENRFDRIYHKTELYNLLKLGVDNLIIIQNSISGDDLVNLKKYSYKDLKKEITEFVEYYIKYKKIYDFPVNDFFNLWEVTYSNQKFDFNYFAHKDFEFINLFLLNKNNSHLKCGIIDFQSAFLGFKGWDLFSFLENSRINFTREYNEDLIKYFYKNTNFVSDFDTFRTQYYILNLARQTRLLGRWVKLINTGNKNFLDYIDPTKNRIISCLNNIKNDKLSNIYKKALVN